MQGGLVWWRRCCFFPKSRDISPPIPPLIAQFSQCFSECLWKEFVKQNDNKQANFFVGTIKISSLCGHNSYRCDFLFLYRKQKNSKTIRVTKQTIWQVIYGYILLEILASGRLWKCVDKSSSTRWPYEQPICTKEKKSADAGTRRKFVFLWTKSFLKCFSS